MKYTSNTIRINFVFIICIALLFILFFAKLSYVALSQEVEGTDIKELAENRVTATKTLTASRGTIYDKNNIVLATNVNSYTLIAYVDPKRTTDERYPKHVVDKELTATKLAEILEPINSSMTREYILKQLSAEKRYQVEFAGAKNLSELVKKQIEAENLPGIDFVKSDMRHYPHDSFASYVIGYVRKREDEMVGELGIEKYCNRYLKGKDGSITYQKDAYGYQLADRPALVDEAQDGYDVYLTLDANVQFYLENAVEEFTEYDPDWVSITVADAKTGAVVGSATSPSYNPNPSKLDITQYNNPLTSYTYEPGSTMKIFSFASAIEENKYNGDELYDTGTIKVDDYTIKDWNRVGWGRISFDTGFTYSSNTAAVKLAQRIKKKSLSEYYDKLGFGSQTGIELSNELNGEVDIEYGTELAAASYGHGITVTPIQMIKALTSITNDGTVLKPYIIDKIIDPNTNEVVYQSKRNEVKKVYSTSTINKIVDLMDKTVNGSDPKATGKVYQTDAVRLIGKTGTANYIGKNGTYVTGTYNVIRSFAGVFPKDDPEYIVYVVVKDFKGSSKNMGSIVKSMVESVAKYRDFDTRPSEKDKSKIINVGNYVNNTVVQATSKLQKVGANVVLLGNGEKIISQFPKPGVETLQSAKIFLMTNGTEFKYPNFIGWSSNDFINYCNMMGLKYELNGYGYVESTNISTDAIINNEVVISANLKNIDPESLITTKGKDGKDGKKES